VNLSVVTFFPSSKARHVLSFDAAKLMLSSFFFFSMACDPFLLLSVESKHLSAACKEGVVV
jgi:hypothetical protein